jgi:hypothetical protein
VLAAALAQEAARPAARPAPEQPLPFSHKGHAGTLKLQCKMCHPNPAPGEAMTFVAPSVCMQCHSTVKADSPAIQKLATFAKENRPVPWVRVYQVPSYVFFNHKAHLDKGASCEECHGPVVERERLSREKDISMPACLDCHRAKNASVDCGFCHEPR